jgi:signal transduction histidine kinase
MIIKDNGVGFDPASKAKGVGLRSLNERVKSLNGSLEIISAPGKGTTITVTAPIMKKRNSR